MKKSLQRIEDHYLNLGYYGDKLRQALKSDREYQEILEEKKSRLSHRFKFSAKDQKKYVLATDDDYLILGKCKELEKKNLSQNDREIVALIKTQLEDEWRKHLIIALNKLSRKY